MIPKNYDYGQAQSFTQINNAIFDDTNLTTYEKITLFALLRYAWDKGECFPSYETLSRITGLSLRTIQNVIKSLAKKEYITVKLLGKGKGNYYYLAPFLLLANKNTIAPHAMVYKNTIAPHATPIAPRADEPKHHVPTNNTHKPYTRKKDSAEKKLDGNSNTISENSLISFKDFYKKMNWIKKGED
jgi:hypothetical protein